MHYYKKMEDDYLKTDDEIVITAVPTPNTLFVRKVKLIC
jgi:hypothetical protein